MTALGQSRWAVLELRQITGGRKQKCGTCNGKGRKAKKKCPTCRGTGRKGN